jgi:cysteine-rich repeat protein
VPTLLDTRSLARIFVVVLVCGHLSASSARAHGLPDSTLRKTAIKCQKALLSAATRFFTKELSVLAKCNSKAVACINNPKPETRAKCLAMVNPCQKTLQTVLAKADNDLGNLIASSCGSLTKAELLGSDGLGFGTVDGDCLSIGSEIVDTASVAGCLRKVYRRSIERLFAIESPRTREFFQRTGVDVGSLPDLPGYPSCDGCSVTGDPKTAKQLTKCSKAITGAGRSFAATAAKLLGKCALALFACEQSPKPLSQIDLNLCRAKAEKKCDQAKQKASTAQGKVSTKVRGACNPVPIEVLTSQSGANIGTLACECNAVNIPDVQTLDDYLACSRLHHECRVAQLIRFAAPRLDGLLENTDSTKVLEDILCAIPPDAPTVSEPRAVFGGILRFLSAIRARFNRPVFGAITKFAVLKPGGARNVIRDPSRRALALGTAAPMITRIIGDQTYAPNQSRQITVGYDLGSLAATSHRAGETPQMLIGVERLDGSLVADDVFALDLEPSVGETDLTVAYSPAVPGETGCSFRLVFGIANGDNTELIPFDLGAGACHINGVKEAGEDCDDGNTIDGDGCDHNCTITRCGNGIVTSGEACDDGNLDPADACPLDCGMNGTPTPTPTPPLSRFVDNGDGTVTDNQTGLQWEKKTTAVGSGENLADPHDVDNRYTWCLDANVDFVCDNGTGPADGPLFTQFLAALNTQPCFAGHCDWRVPTVGQEGDPAELETIVDLSRPGCGAGTPCIAQIFGPTLVNASYWSATTSVGSPLDAWRINFTDGAASIANKHNVFLVRAIRGGS